MFSTAPPHPPTQKSYPNINILGAGIAGLSLACHLRRRHIPFTIFDGASKTKSHNYGITIKTRALNELLGTFPPGTTRGCRQLTAVDRLIGGVGVTSTSKGLSRSREADDFRASDAALRDVLAREHKIRWNHRLTGAEHTARGLKLVFENGDTSTASITIDAAGERSKLAGLLGLQDLEPEVLPYAVYHGSRYIPRHEFDRDFKDIFRNDENVRDFPPSHNGKEGVGWHLQIAKVYITRDQVPSKVREDFGLDPSNDELVVESRYTFSRLVHNTSSENNDSKSQLDPLLNPNRAKDEAKNIPEAFYTSTETYLSSTTNSTLPPRLQSLLSPSSLRQDRILNWLLRIHPQRLHTTRLRTLADKGVIGIGDAVHATPPIQSQGADIAMLDAEEVAGWIDGADWEGSENGEVDGAKVMGFYERRAEVWKGVVDEARLRIARMHGQDGGGVEGAESRLSGRT